MKITRRVVGRPAAGYRRSFAIEKKRRQLLERKWGKRFPGTRVSEVKFSDLQDLESPVSYSCRTRLPRFAATEDGEMSFEHNLTNYRFVERYASLSKRRHAYVMRYVFQAIFDTTVRLPEGYRFTARVSDVDLKTPFGAMTRKCVVDGEKMTITQNIQMDAWRVEPSDHPAWRKFCMAMDEKLTEKIRISR